MAQRIFLILVLSTSVHLALAERESVQPSYEVYSERVSIGDVASRSHPELSLRYPRWNQIRRSELEAAIFLLKLHPDHELFYYARDMERLYDASVLVAPLIGENPKRVHLINLSQRNVRHFRRELGEPAEAYLDQEMLPHLLAGKKALSIDTGPNGHLQALVRIYYERFRPQMDEYYIAKDTGLRMIAVGVGAGPKIDSMEDFHDEFLLSAYEYLPHETARSDQIVKRGERWEPISPLPKKVDEWDREDDGVVSPQSGRRMREDLKHFVLGPEGVAITRQLSHLWTSVRNAYRSGDSDLVKELLRENLEHSHDDPMGEARVRDFMELARRRLKGRVILSPGMFGLSPEHTFFFSNDVKDKYPQFAWILDHLEESLPVLVSHGEWDLIREIFPVANKRIFPKAFAKVPAPLSDEGKKFVSEVLCSSPGWASEWIRDVFATPVGPAYEAEILAALQRFPSNRDLRSDVVAHVISQPHAEGHYGALIAEILKRADQDTLRLLIRNAWRYTSNRDREKLTAEILKKGDQQTKEALALQVAQVALQRDSAAGIDKIISEDRSGELCQVLAEAYFPRADLSDPATPERLKAMGTKANHRLIHTLLEEVLSRPEARAVPALMPVSIAFKSLAAIPKGRPYPDTAAIYRRSELSYVPRLIRTCADALAQGVKRRSE